jgi:hypothetical protein
VTYLWAKFNGMMAKIVKISKDFAKKDSEYAPQFTTTV